MPKPGGTGRGTVSGAAPGSKVASRSLDRFTVELRVDLTPIQREGEVNVSWGVPEHSNHFLAGVVGGGSKVQALRNNNCLEVSDVRKCSNFKLAKISAVLFNQSTVGFEVGAGLSLRI